MKGPDLLQPQFGILIRFRENLVAVSADIERMFNQVLVPKCDRSDLRFIWQQLGTTEPLRTYEIYVQVFGCISSPITCNYTLLRAAQDGFGDFPVAEARVQANFYVDNYLDSFDDEKAASAAAHNISTLLDRGGFRLTKWLSTSGSLLSSLPVDRRGKPELDLERDAHREYPGATMGCVEGRFRHKDGPAFY